MCEYMGGYRCVSKWEDKHVRTWKDTDIEYVGACRCMRTWEDADVIVHGRLQVRENMGGYRCVRTSEDTDI